MKKTCFRPVWSARAVLGAPARRLSAAALLFASSLPALAQQSKDPGITPGATGSVTFTYLGKKVTLTTVRGKDGNVWLQQKLGSKSVAKALNDEDAYGDLFQWGRWDDGHQVREPQNSSHKELDPNNPAGLKKDKNPFIYSHPFYWWWKSIENDHWDAATPADVTATDGCDPCKALGEGWHLPTIEEWQAVVDAEEITDGSSGINSNLKLAFAGERLLYTAYLANMGAQGTFWASNCCLMNPSGAGYLFGIDMNGVYLKDAYYYRGSGLSIRCMKKKK